MEPVEIEINLKQNISEESEKAKKAIQNLSSSSQEFIDTMSKTGVELDDISDRIAKQKDYVDKLKKSHKDATDVFNNTYNEYVKRTPGYTRESVNEAYENSEKIYNIFDKEVENLKILEEKHNSILSSMEKKAVESTETLGKSMKNTFAPHSVNQVAKEITDALDELVSRYNSVTETFNSKINNKNIEDKAQVYKEYLNELQAVTDKLKAINRYGAVESSGNKQIAEAYETSKKILVDINKELSAEKKNLDLITQSADKQLSVLTKQRKVRDEMASLINKDGTISPENLKRYDELKVKLEEISVANRIIQQEQKNANNSAGAQLSGIMNGISGVAGAFAAGQGIVSLFVKDNERLAAIQTKLQAAMSITIGLQQVSNTLHVTSAFRLNTMNTLTNMWTASTNRLSKALNISNTSAKLLAGVGIGLLIAAVVSIVDAYKEWKSEQEAVRQEMLDMKNSASASVAPLAVSVNKLSKEWSSLGNNMKDKEQFIRSNQEKFKELGVEIRNVDEAENLLNTNKDKFIESMKQRALSIAALELASTKYKEALEAQVKAEDYREQLAKSSFWKNALFGASKDDVSALFEYNRQKELADKNFQQANKHIETSIDTNEKYTESTKEMGIQLTESSKQAIEGTKAYYEYIRNERQKELDNMKRDQIGSNEWNRIKKERDEAAKILKEWDKTKEKSDKNTAKREQNEAQKKLDAQRKLDEKLRQIENDRFQYQVNMRQRTIGLMEDGFEKEFELVELEYEKQLQAIRDFSTKKLKEQQEIERLQWQADGRKGTFTPITTDISQLSDEVRRQIAEMNDAALKEWTKGFLNVSKSLNDFRNEERLRFASSLDKELADIDNYYRERLLKVERGSNDEALLIDNREKEKDAAVLRSKQRQIEFEAQYNDRLQTIINNRYLFESDKQEAIIRQRIDSQKRILENLRKQFANDPNNTDLANSIKMADLEMQGLNEELNRTKTDKIKEVKDQLSQIADIISLFDEDAGQAIGIYLQGIEGLGQAAAGILSGNPQQAVDGVMKVAETTARIINLSKQARREIKQFYYEIEQAAINYSIAVINSIKDIKSAQDSIFFTDSSNALSKGMEGYNSAITKQTELINELGNVSIAVGKKKKKTLGVTTGTKTIWENILTGYKKVLNTDDELIDKSGRLNKELAEQLLNSGKLSKEATDLINQILDAQDAADSAMQQVENILSNLAGTIGDDLKNALTDAFRAGTSEAEAFGQSVSKILENVISDMIFSQVFGDMLAELEDRMKQSYSEGGDQSLVDDIAWFYNNYQQGIEEYNKSLEELRQQVKEMTGLDIFGGGDLEASSAGIERMSQDSANELNGNFYAVRQMLGDVRNMDKEANLMRKSMLSVLSDIAENTSYCALLEDINNKLDDIGANGLKLHKY